MTKQLIIKKINLSITFTKLLKFSKRSLSNKINLVLLVLLLSFIGCQSSQEDYRIEEQKMINVLTDIHLSEVALQSVSVTLKDSMAEVYYDQVFEIHGVKEDDFNHDIDLIRANAETLKLYYSKILEKLNKDEKEFLKVKKDTTSFDAEK